MTDLDAKLVFGVVATLLTIFGYLPYLRDMFARKTKPHLYTWLIWALTQGTATAILIHGGGKYGALSLMVGTLFVLIIFGSSFVYGTKNVTKSDTITLLVAFLAILVWWQLHNPLVALIMVTAIDATAFIPTIRKSFQEPWTETLSFWFLMLAASLLTILSNAEYSVLTMLYLTMLTIANTVMVTLLVARRRTLGSSVVKRE